jgi:hypothetical protein
MITHDANGGHSDLYDRIDILAEQIAALEKRVDSLEADTPQARQLRYEADLAVADAREFDRHGDDCGCSYCATDDDEAPS